MITPASSRTFARIASRLPMRTAMRLGGTMRANCKQDPNNQAITKTLEITANFAFRMLRKGKYRKASTIAHDALRYLPPETRKTADAAMLRVIGSSGKHIADFFAAEDSARKRTKRTRRTSRASGEVAPMALATSHLLLLPEYPMVPGDSPVEMADKS